MVSNLSTPILNTITEQKKTIISSWIAKKFIEGPDPEHSSAENREWSEVTCNTKIVINVPHLTPELSPLIFYD